jgi:hypothetical protein
MPKDSLSPEGAHKLSLALQTYWRSKGLMGVKVQAVRIKLNTDSIPANMWAIRSNLTFDGNGNARLKETNDEGPNTGSRLSEPDTDFAERPIPKAFQSIQGKAPRRRR